MRRLRILVRRSRGALPVLATAAIVQVTSCSDDDEHVRSTGQGAHSGSGGAGGTGGTRDAASGSGGSAGVIVLDSGRDPSGGTSGAGGVSCFSPETYVVALPEPGVPAEPGQICAVSTEPVGSYRAARVTLAKTGTGLENVAGSIAIDPMLLAQVVGLPELRVIDVSRAELRELQVSGMAAAPGGFAFQGRWPAPLPIGSSGAMMTVAISFEINCAADAMDLRRVEARTDVHACVDGAELEWVSSGGDCTICRIIAEMAPSPIVPEKPPDGLPLAQAIRLRLVEVARVGRTVVLLAENDGGEGLEYLWQASSGTLERLAADVVAWTPEDGIGPQHVQAAVLGEFGVAVRSYNGEVYA